MPVGLLGFGRNTSFRPTAGSLNELSSAATLAEEADFESVWSTEFYDRSATISLCAMAQATSYKMARR